MNARFLRFRFECDKPTEQWIEGRTNGRTETLIDLRVRKKLVEFIKFYKYYTTKEMER